ncbi:hypothetical protein PIB30_079658 [Stylosanthes scabra]|uniref:Putative plant transposon protein domain-containing protein n=1 Tax=Stylosanthes scabra TaxID=79078 RepID=A0ABU6SSG6_9FABA|nr:hypothetical protein [Stylosanthes scabra]
MASSSSVSVFDNHRFKSAFNEELYNIIVKNKKVIAECCIDLDEDEYLEIREQIALRGWRRLSAPKQEISIDLIHEFYANAVVTEEEMEEAGGNIFRSFVRGVPVDFSPGNIQTVMRFRTGVQGAVTDFETRKEHDQQLDQVLADLCMPGATWKLSTGQLTVPIQLRRQELNPVARGWHELSIHSLIPSSNRFEIPDGVHKITRPVQRRQQEDEEEDHPMPQAGEGTEEENVEQQGYDHDYHYQPDFEQQQPEFEHHQEFNEPPVQQLPLYHVPTYTDQHQKDLASIEEQLQNMMWYQQQTLENISKNQADYMAKLRDIKGKQQELYDNNDRFYNQVRQKQREMVQEIQQIKNYQVNQTLVDSTRHKADLDELPTIKKRQEEFFSNQVTQYNMIRQDQKLLGKEILDMKKYQMSAVTMGSGESSSSPQPPPPPYEPDQALMKIREQHANFTEITRQPRDWTRNASARESYSVWAHQQANPNLVEMSSQKIVKQIYDNIDHKRPMFRGLLKSDLQPSNPAPPPSSSKDPKDPPK